MQNLASNSLALLVNSLGSTESHSTSISTSKINFVTKAPREFHVSGIASVNEKNDGITLNLNSNDMRFKFSDSKSDANYLKFKSMFEDKELVESILDRYKQDSNNNDCGQEFKQIQIFLILEESLQVL